MVHKESKEALQNLTGRLE